MKWFSKLFVLYKTSQKKSLCHYVTPLKKCYLSSIVPSSFTWIFTYFDKYSVSFQYSFPVQNSEDLKISYCVIHSTSSSGSSNAA